MNVRLVVAVVLLSAGAALAETEEPETKKPPPFQYEVVMGFGGQVIDPASLPLVLTEGPLTNVPGLAGVAAPFGGPNLRQLITAGPAWEIRWTHRYLRFTTGLSKPWGQFRQGELDADLVSSPLAMVRASPRSLSLWLLRFGLGGEVSFGRVTPFIDVLGDLQWASAEIVVDGQRGEWRSSGFGFSARAGARFRIDEHLVIGLAGEVGLAGAPRYGASLLAGWAFPLD